METLKAISSRKSTRSYKKETIRSEILEAILQAGMSAPVGSGDYDSLCLTVVQNDSLFQKINSEVTDLIFRLSGKKMDKNFGAPVMIFVSSKPAAMAGIEYANAACVLENMAIAATSLGIDSIIWGGAAAAVAQSSALMQDLKIPSGYRPLLCISLGYAKENETPIKHKISVNMVL